MSKTPAAQIVWIDCEMTGLDVLKHTLVEVAVIITDFELNPVHEGFEIIINPGAAALSKMGDFVRQMHSDSGLLERIADGVSMADAEQQLIAYISAHVADGAKPLVAGNTIGMDRRFIAHYMPELDALLHYRSLDVSTLKELARRWYPAVYHNAPPKQGGHRALADIRESITELAYFRAAMLVPAPGPDNAENAQICADILGSAAPAAAVHGADTQGAQADS